MGETFRKGDESSRREESVFSSRKRRLTTAQDRKPRAAFREKCVLVHDREQQRGRRVTTRCED